MSLDDQIIIAMVYPITQNPWLLFVIYASPNPLYQQDLWDYLRGLGTVVTIPWLLLGDFNQVLHNSEKRGGIPTLAMRMQAFREVILAYDLIDLGFSGPRFTWTNMRKGLANVQERLDKALCNHGWLHMFASARVSHLTRTCFDHCPMLVSDGIKGRWTSGEETVSTPSVLVSSPTV